MKKEKIKAIIVDDEIEAQDILANLMKDFTDINVLAKASSVDDALPQIIKFQPDIVFLDIDMPDKNGFELVKELKNSQFNTTIIFVTAFNHYAIDAIKHAAFDYIMKPVDIDDLQICISRYKKEVNSHNFISKIENLLISLKKEKLRINIRGGFIFIEPDEIIYCKADGNYTDIYISGDDRGQTVTLNLGNLLKILPDNFSRINRSIIINRAFLKEVNRKNKICKIDSPKGEMSFDIPRNYIKQLETI